MYPNRSSIQSEGCFDGRVQEKCGQSIIVTLWVSRSYEEVPGYAFARQKARRLLGQTLYCFNRASPCGPTHSKVPQIAVPLSDSSRFIMAMPLSGS